MTVYNFQEKLAASRSKEEREIGLIKRLISDCESVEKTEIGEDLRGADYAVILKSGSRIYVDAKTRDQNCSSFWRKKGQGPELALELWSAKPEDGSSGKIGWTLNESSLADYILFTFDPKDSSAVFLYPFHLLRIVFLQNLSEWGDKYEHGHQDSKGSNGRKWKSECIFVPEIVVFKAVAQLIRRCDGVYSGISRCKKERVHA